MELKEDLNVEIPEDFIKKLETKCEEILIKKIKHGKTIKIIKYKT